MSNVTKWPVFAWAPSPVPPTGRSEQFMDLGGLARIDTLESVVAALVQYLADTDKAGYVTVRNIMPVGKR